MRIWFLFIRFNNVIFKKVLYCKLYGICYDKMYFDQEMVIIILKFLCDFRYNFYLKVNYNVVKYESR